MPYIKEESRILFENVKKELEKVDIDSAGSLNYLITLVISRYLEQRGGIQYALLNDAIGALEGAKLELYRRLAGPYEDGKIEQNGDVYPKKLTSK